MNDNTKIEAWSYEEQPKAPPIFNQSDHGTPTVISPADVALADALAKAVREQAAMDAAQSRPSHMHLYINILAMTIVIMCVFIASMVALKAKH